MKLLVHNKQHAAYFILGDSDDCASLRKHLPDNKNDECYVVATRHFRYDELLAGRIPERLTNDANPSTTTQYSIWTVSVVGYRTGAPFREGDLWVGKLLVRSAADKQPMLTLLRSKAKEKDYWDAQSGDFFVSLVIEGKGKTRERYFEEVEISCRSTTDTDEDLVSYLSQLLWLLSYSHILSSAARATRKKRQ